MMTGANFYSINPIERSSFVVDIGPPKNPKCFFHSTYKYLFNVPPHPPVDQLFCRVHPPHLQERKIYSNMRREAKKVGELWSDLL